MEPRNLPRQTATLSQRLAVARHKGVLIALVVIHVCAALIHHFFQRDDVLNRMAVGEAIKNPAPESV